MSWNKTNGEEREIEMRADEVHKTLNGHFDVDSLDRTALRRLREILTDSGYSEPAIYRALDIPYFTMMTLYALPIFLHFKLTDHTPFNCIVKLFLLSQSMKREEIIDLLFTDRELKSLISMGILKEDDGRVRSQVDIYPCMDSFIATDHRFTDQKSPRAVMYLSRDSYTLARGTIREPVRRTLDLCTGSGVHAILAARHSEEVVGVDINARAINFAEFNRVFNDVENVRFLKGDLFAPVEGERFDLILANPPFVPHPGRGKRLFFRDGGYSGEVILDQILMNAGRFLTERGICQIFTEVLLKKKNDYLEKLAGKMGDRPFDILVLAGNHIASEMYAIGHLKYREDYQDFTNELVEWVRCLYDNGITQIAEGLITASPAEKGSSPSQTMLQYKIPNWPFGDKVAQYMDSLKASSKERDISELIPVINDEVNCIWKGRSPEGRESCTVEFSEKGLPVDEPLSSGENEVLELCDGQRTAGKVACLSAAANGSGSTLSCIEHLKSLARKQVIKFKNASLHINRIMTGLTLLFYWASEDIIELLSFIELSSI